MNNWEQEKAMRWGESFIKNENTKDDLEAKIEEICAKSLGTPRLDTVKMGVGAPVFNFPEVLGAP